MQVQINKPVTLGKNTYTKGQHDILADEAKGWFFDALVNEGSIVILEATTPDAREANEGQNEAKAKRKTKKNVSVPAQENEVSEGE